MPHMKDGHFMGAEKGQQTGSPAGGFFRIMQRITAAGEIIILDIDGKKSGIHENTSLLYKLTGKSIIILLHRSRRIIHGETDTGK